MSPRDGYGFDPAAMISIVGGLDDASSSLASGLEVEPGTPDAGISSDKIAAAMQRVMEANVILGKVISDMGGNVDAAKGNYDDMENSNTDTFAQNERMAQSVHPHDPGPLLDSPKERAN